MEVEAESEIKSDSFKERFYLKGLHELKSLISKQISLPQSRRVVNLSWMFAVSGFPVLKSIASSAWLVIITIKRQTIRIQAGSTHNATSHLLSIT